MFMNQYFLFYIVLYFTMNPQWICSYGVTAVYYILPMSLDKKEEE